MDNLTHSLTGILLARAGLRRLAPASVPLAVVAANAPDFDIVAGLWGSVAYLEAHRGWTHSIVAAPLLALALLPFWFLWARRRHTVGPRQWAGAFVVALAGVLSNPLLDLPNVYGTRLLLPFDARWLHFDFVPVIDLWIWALLLLAVAGPLLSRLVNIEIGARSKPGPGGAIFALLLLGAFLGLRYQLHHNAVALLSARVYGGETPRRILAIPDAAAPWRWRGVIETASAWHTLDLDLLRDFDPEDARVFYKPSNLARFDALRATPTGRVFLDFCQVPLWRVVPVASPDGGLRVSIHDLRFGLPEDAMFTARFVFDSNLRVVDESLTLGARRGDSP
jgi:inner membrane protein